MTTVAGNSGEHTSAPDAALQQIAKLATVATEHILCLGVRHARPAAKEVLAEINKTAREALARGAFPAGSPTDAQIDVLLTSLYGRNKLMPYSPLRPEKRQIVRDWLEDPNGTE